MCVILFCFYYDSGFFTCKKRSYDIINSAFLVRLVPLVTFSFYNLGKIALDPTMGYLVSTIYH